MSLQLLHLPELCARHASLAMVWTCKDHALVKSRTETSAMEQAPRQT